MDDELSKFTDDEIEAEYEDRHLGFDSLSLSEASDEQLIDEVSGRGIEDDILRRDFDVLILAEDIRQGMNCGKSTANRVRLLVEQLTGKLVFE